MITLSERPLGVSSTASGMTCRRVLIGPEEARALLAHNENNRRVRQTAVMQFATDMREGRWTETPAPIMVSVDGLLLDGQHRLLAIVEAEARLWFWIAYDVPVEVYEHTDLVRPRTLGDFLHRRGVPDAISKAAVINRLWRWEKRRTFAPWPGDAPTISQALQYWFEHDDEINIATSRARPLRTKTFVFPSLMIALAVIFSRIDDEDLCAFLERLASGADLSKGDAVLLLRNRLISEYGATLRARDSYIAAITIKAWNAYREGRPLFNLAWRPGGADAEAFPQPG